MSEDFAPADSLADDAIDFFSLNVPRPGGQHVGMYFAPIVAVHRATGISVTVSDVERSQFATRNKAQERLMMVLTELRERRVLDLSEPHMVQVARIAAALPIDEEAERMVDAMMAKAIEAGGSRKLTMPALTDEEREVLTEFREAFGGTHYTKQWVRALAILDRLTKVSR